MQTIEPSTKPDQQPSATEELLETNSVGWWCKRIRSAKSKYKDDFKRMRENMKFAAGLQWPGQKKMDDARYKANWINQAVNNKVASLYAKNPTVEYQRRPRLDFQIYNGRLESLQPVVMKAMSGIPLQLPEIALMMDFQHGMAQRDLIDRIGKTLEILFQYQMDEQTEEEGEFKIQMKQLVRRVITCGVGYCRVSFARDIDSTLSSWGAGTEMVNKTKFALNLMEQLQDGKIEDTNPKVQQLNSLLAGLQFDLVDQMRDPEVKERLVFDFIPSTKVIVDPKCRMLKGFVGADWIAQEFILPIADVNALFEVDIKVGQLKQYNPDGSEKTNSSAPSSESKLERDPICCLWEVMNKKTGEHFYVVDGFKDWVQEPQPLQPCVRGFWPIVALTFNDVEMEEDLPVTIYPPSDVDLLRDSQKEWNRSRNELKKHRKANAPGYLASKGMLTDNDKSNLENAESNSVVELEGVPLGTALEKVIIPRANVQIQAALYDTGPQLQDRQMVTGENATPQIPTKRASATGETIAEQKAISVTGSNIDDQDDFLSGVARIGGELLLKMMQKETVIRIVGGGVWPETNTGRSEYLNQIFLVTKAASSGRPNKVLDINNWKVMAPLLMQAGANPQFMVRESLRRLDDQLDPEQAFPLVPPMMGNQLPQGGQHQPGEQEEHQPGVNQPPQQQRPGPGKTGARPTKMLHE